MNTILEFKTVYKSRKLFFLAFIFSLSLFSQESIVSSGGDAMSTEGSVSFTTGQPFFNFYSDDNNSISEGIQQSIESSILSINDVEPQGIFSIYPIPTSNYLNLKISDYTIENLNYEIIDLQGRVVLRNKVISSETTIDLNKLGQSMYFFNLNKNNKLIQSTKILKY